MNYATLVLAALGFASGFLVQGWRYDSVIANLKLEHSQAQLVNTEKLMSDFKSLQKAKDEALAKAKQQASLNATAAATAASERDSLRSQLSDATGKISDASCTSVRNYATTVTAVFNECVSEYEEMARKAQGHALDARTLIDAWPTLPESR